MHGAEAARLTAESHTAAINKMSEICIIEKVDCDFDWLDGFLFAAAPDAVGLLDDALAAAHRAGLTGVEKVARAPVGMNFSRKRRKGAKKNLQLVSLKAFLCAFASLSEESLKPLAAQSPG